jgi:hypothetical protein
LDDPLVSRTRARVPSRPNHLLFESMPGLLSRVGVNIFG